MAGGAQTVEWFCDARAVVGESIAWDAAQNRLVWVDLVDKTVFLLPFDPDGSTQDCEGGIWNCRVVGGTSVIRVLPDGTVDRAIDLPCSLPTSCTFGGENLDILFVTSARFGMSEAHLAANPHGGGLFAVKPGIRGRPSIEAYHRFTPLLGGGLSSHPSRISLPRS